MSLYKIKELSGFDVYQEYNQKTNLTEYFSWRTNYLDKDFTEIKFDTKDGVDKICFNIDYRNQTIPFSIVISDKISFETDNVEVSNIAQHVKCKTNNLYDFLLVLSTNINNINDLFENKNKESDVVVEDEEDKSMNDESEYEYEDSEGEYDPYNEFKSIEQGKVNLFALISKFRNTAKKRYERKPFVKGKLDISAEFIINVILKEIESIYKNCDGIIMNPVDDDIFNINIEFTTFENEKLNKNMADFNIESIIMNIKLDSNLYPYYPPQVSFKTNIDNKLDVAIINLNYFKVESWNPTNTLEQLVNGIKKILNDNCVISQSNVLFPNINSTLQNIMSLNSILPNCLKSYDINIDFVKLAKVEEKSNDSKHWASGVGYGYSGRNDWDINKFIETKRTKLYQNIDLFQKLNEEIIKNIQDRTCIDFLINSDLLEVLDVFCKQLNLVEFDSNYKFYGLIFNILNVLKLDQLENIPTIELSKIAESIQNFYNESLVFLKLNKKESIQADKLDVINTIIKYYEQIKKFYNPIKHIDNQEEKYCEEMKDMQFHELEEEEFSTHKYKNGSFNPTDECIKKISKELATYHNSLPLNYSSSVFVRYDENNVQLIKALIVGPKDTPYENGCFIFDIYIPNNYPHSPPKVNLQTTGYGKVRFNPNLYNCGKVCLSLLGTWSGSQQEKWNKDTSTLLQVLVSIQSLIFVEDPYFNEPGYERDMHTTSGKERSFKYNEIRRKATVEYAICDMIKTVPTYFKDVVKKHFEIKKDEIKETVGKWYDETTEKKNEFNYIINNMINLI